MEEEKLEASHKILVTTSTSWSAPHFANRAIISPVQTNLNQSEGNQNLNEVLFEEKTVDSNSIPKLIYGTNVYEMLSKPRGFCLIINNVDFDDNRFPKRIGSDEESLRLSNIFQTLHFHVS